MTVTSDNIDRSENNEEKNYCPCSLRLLFALCVCPLEAQQPTKIPRIGYLTAFPSPIAARTEAFRQGLRELGYVEGKNIVIE